MADPVTMMIVAAGSQAIGQIVGGYASGAAADTNARIADQNKDAAIQQGAAREVAQRRSAARFLGEQTTAIAESGVDPGSGSPLRVQQESETRAELDALNIRYEALMQATGYRRESEMERRRAKQARRGGYMAAVTTVLGTAARGYGMDAPKSSGGPPPSYYGGSGMDSVGDRWGR